MSVDFDHLFFDGPLITRTIDHRIQVAIDGIKYADNPNFESYMPAYNETLGLVGSGGKYLTRWSSTPGLNMDTEIQALKTEMQGIWDKAK